jgi:hypothetical protein
MAQSNKFHAGMCTFGSQILVVKVCEYIKSGHTFGRRAVKCQTGGIYMTTFIESNRYSSENYSPENTVLKIQS